MTAVLRSRGTGHKEATMAKPWRCRVGRHRWQRLRNPEGGWYRRLVGLDDD